MDEYNPYKNMTLRQELEARFDEVDRKQKEQDALDYIRNNMQFSQNNAWNINTDQQPTGWSDPTNINSGFGGSIVGQHIDNAVNQPNGNNWQNAQTSFLSGNTSYPYESAIKNEIYNKDKTMYEQLYGSTPPQMKKSAVQPRIWESAADGKRVYDDVVRQEGNFVPSYQNPFEYATSAVQGGISLANNFQKFHKMRVTDKYKHAMMNCLAAQYGQGGADVAEQASNLREWYDVKSGSNTLDSSTGDQYANKIGRLLGGKYPYGDCNEYVQKYIKKEL